MYALCITFMITRINHINVEIKSLKRRQNVLTIINLKYVKNWIQVSLSIYYTFRTLIYFIIMIKRIAIIKLLRLVGVSNYSNININQNSLSCSEAIKPKILDCFALLWFPFLIKDR